MQDKKDELLPQELEETPDSSIFVPDPEEIAAIWTAKPLSLRNTTLIVRMFATFIAQAAIRMRDVFDDEDNFTEEGVVQLISLLDADMLARLLCIITGADRETVEKTYKVSRALEVIILFWKQEELGGILGKAKTLATNQEFRERNVG